MPTILMFYGIIVRMYFFDNQQHSLPHKRKQKLVDAWVEIHRDELVADWELAINGEPIFKIDPLK